MASTNDIDIKVIAEDLASETLAQIRKQIKDTGDEGEKSSKGASTFSSALSGIASVAGGIISAQIITRLTSGIVDFASQAIDGAKNAEQLQIAFTTMLGSGEKAKDLMNQIAKAAATTPFELPELQNASKQLLAFGIEADNVVPTLMKLGDVAAGIGAPVGDLAYLFGTIKTQGKAMTVDINQFANRGIPIWDELAKVTGKSGDALRDLVEAGKVGFPEINAAFDDLTQNGGKFAGLMDAQSKSLAGIQSNISDTVNQLLVSIVNDSGLFDMLKSGADNFLSFLSANAGTIKDFFKGLIEGFILIRKEAIPALQKLLPSLERFIDPIKIFIENVAPGFQKFFEKVVEIVGSVLPVIFSRIQPAIEAFSNLWNNVWQVAGEILAKVFEVAQPLLEFLGKVLGGVLPPLLDFFIGLVNEIGNAFTTVWAIIEPVVNFIIDLLKTVFYLIEWLWNNVAKPSLQMWVDFFNNNIKPALVALQPVFKAVADYVQVNLVDPVLIGLKQVQEAMAIIRQDNAEAAKLGREIASQQEQQTAQRALSNGKDDAAKSFLKKDPLSMSIWGAGGIDALSGDKLYTAAASAGFKFATGADFVTNGAMPMVVGDNGSGKEHVTVTPLDGSGRDTSGSNKNVSIVQNFINTVVDPAVLSSNLAFRIGLL